MARLKEDADGREKGESCKAKYGKGLQVGFVFGKRTQQAGKTDNREAVKEWAPVS